MRILIQEKRNHLHPTTTLNSIIVRAFHKARWAWGKVKAYREVCVQRRMLAEMNDFQLKDIGISRADALQETNKPFWK